MKARRELPRELAKDIEIFNAARARYHAAVADPNLTPGDVRRFEAIMEQRRTCLLFSLLSDRTDDTLKLEVLSCAVTSFGRDSVRDVSLREALSRVVLDLVHTSKCTEVSK